VFSLRAGLYLQAGLSQPIDASTGCVLLSRGPGRRRAGAHVTDVRMTTRFKEDDLTEARAAVRLATAAKA